VRPRLDNPALTECPIFLAWQAGLKLSLMELVHKDSIPMFCPDVLFIQA
jgi:hypothetical protein